MIDIHSWRKIILGHDLYFLYIILHDMYDRTIILSIKKRYLTRMEFSVRNDIQGASVVVHQLKLPSTQLLLTARGNNGSWPKWLEPCHPCGKSGVKLSVSAWPSPHCYGQLGCESVNRGSLIHSDFKLHTYFKNEKVTTKKWSNVKCA